MTSRTRTALRAAGTSSAIAADAARRLAGYASVLEALGRHEESIAAARTALAIQEQPVAKSAFGDEHAFVADVQRAIDRARARSSAAR